MANRKFHEKLTVMDAVDNLSLLAELDLPSVAEELPVEPPLEEEEHPVLWTDPQAALENQEKFKETFRIIHSYLQNLWEKDKERLSEPETQRGIQAIMVLAGEAVVKVDKYTSLFKGAIKKSVAELKEYKQLQDLYQNKISRRFTRILEIEEPWEKEWAKEEEAVEVQRKALKSLETVRKDKEYELFFIKKEDGKPFFNRGLLRHVRLLGDFDEAAIDLDVEDPLLRMRILQDRDAHLCSKEILQQCANPIDEFFKEAMHHKGKALVSILIKAVMALLLASNTRNLLSHTETKNCLAYFTDFHAYLREALASAQYQKFLTTPFEGLESFSQVILNLCHVLCFAFFSHQANRVEELTLINRLIEHGEKLRKEARSSPLPFWEALMEQDANIRYLLKRHPNGPLLKAFDIFREHESKEGFDPFLQGNLPSQLFYISTEELHATCLRLPCPTHQDIINKAEIVEEFKGFLRMLGSRMKKQRHLLVNLQDKTSWNEHARCKALEELSKEGEFSGTFAVVTLPKDTSFYHQSDIYRNLSEADHFIEQFKEQIAGGEQCGFYFSQHVNMKKIAQFVDKAMDIVHKVFFNYNKELSRKNRLDFIEIFYNLLVVKLIEEIEPDSFSFTCKDAIDTGVAASAGLYSFLRTLGNAANWKEEEKDFLLWMLYTPALLVRERAIDPHRMHRFASWVSMASDAILANRKGIVNACSSLYNQEIFLKMKVEAAA